MEVIYKVSDIRSLISESSNEFKAVLGSSVENENKKNCTVGVHSLNNTVDIVKYGVHNFSRIKYVCNGNNNNNKRKCGSDCLYTLTEAAKEILAL